MKNTLKKISGMMKKIFGYGMLVSLAVGCLMFLGYVVALIIGGEAAAAICDFIYKGVVPVLIYATSALVLFGLVAMYLGGEVALSNKKKKDAPADNKPQEGTENAKAENGEGSSAEAEGNADGEPSGSCGTAPEGAVDESCEDSTAEGEPAEKAD